VLGIQNNPELAATFSKQGQFESATFDRALQLIRDHRLSRRRVRSRPGK